MPSWQASAPRSTISATAAPEPSPSRISSATTGRIFIAPTSRPWPGSALSWPIRQWASASGSSRVSTAAAAEQMKPSRITGMRSSRARSTAPQIAACSRPPKAASVSRAVSGRCRASPAATTRSLLASMSPAAPLPGPTHSPALPPKVAAARAAATVELPMPISPSSRMSACGSTASAPARIAASTSAAVIAGPVLKSAVGRSSSSGITDRSAPAARQSWLIAAPPA